MEREVKDELIAFPPHYHLLKIHLEYEQSCYTLSRIKHSSLNSTDNMSISLVQMHSDVVPLATKLVVLSSLPIILLNLQLTVREVTDIHVIYGCAEQLEMLD